MRQYHLLLVAALAILLVISGCFGKKKTSESEEDGTIVVNSTPQGATIYLDGAEPRLVTPATIENVEPGEHTILLEKSGYQNWSETFDLDSGETHVINANLVPEGYYNTSLEIYSTPSGSSIYLDGTCLEYTTPVIVQSLVPGSHHVRLYLAGYNEYNEYFDIADGETYVIDAILSVPQYPVPVFTIYSPLDGESFNDNVVHVMGSIELENGNPFTGDTAIMTLNDFDQEIYVYYGSFDEYISIGSGTNHLSFRANSPNGDTGVSDEITIYGNFVAPDIEVVLTWNSPTADMDLHIWNPFGEWCYWWNMIISDGSLDIDDTSGYGPETFTCQTANVGEYVVKVNSFDLDEDPYTDCTIQVYFEGQLAGTFGPHRFTVDDGMENWDEDEHPAWWNVVNIVVTGNREIKFSNHISDELANKIAYDMENMPRQK
ncbi:MAG: PEGA domain-containing protein [Candidatus Cloacimonetes bacterium]|nr:PEGA domain-containing protein [Candidatus Cloacimonadota bacterium]